MNLCATGLLRSTVLGGPGPARGVICSRFGGAGAGVLHMETEAGARPTPSGQPHKKQNPKARGTKWFRAAFGRRAADNE